MRAFNVDEIDTLCVLFTALLCHKKTLSRLVFCKYNWDKALCDLAAAAAMPFVRKLSLALKKENIFFFKGQCFDRYVTMIAINKCTYLFRAFCQN